MDRRTVSLRAERDGSDARFLQAYVDGDGNLHIDGQDLGPSTAMVSDDGEYEWFQVFAARDVPRIVALLDGDAGDDVLDVISRWTGNRSYELEERLRTSDIPLARRVWP